MRGLNDAFWVLVMTAKGAVSPSSGHSLQDRCRPIADTRGVWEAKEVSYRLLFVAFLAIQGCSHMPNSKAEELFDEIEGQVQMPEKARSLADYARYYAPDQGGKVRGVYLLPFPELPAGSDQGCAEMTDNFELKDVPCPPTPAQPEALKAGQRRWVNNQRDLPLINDGGCGVIEVLFDLKTRKVQEVTCNGIG